MTISIHNEANLTMLKPTKWIVQKESLQKQSIKRSQITKSTSSIKTTRNISPAIFNPKQNQNTLNHHTYSIQPIGAQNNRSTTLREQINCRLNLHMKSKRGYLVDHQLTSKNKQNNECLSSLRKMLTEYSPQHQTYSTKTKMLIQQTLRTSNRAKERKQFQIRQSQLLQKKRQKQEQGLANKLLKQTMGCTFKPKLTNYHKR